MLVLSRKKNEEIMIGDQICITVIETRGDKVRLGFTAPREVTILRAEVHERIACSDRGVSQQSDPARHADD